MKHLLSSLTAVMCLGGLVTACIGHVIDDNGLFRLGVLLVLLFYTPRRSG